MLKGVPPSSRHNPLAGAGGKIARGREGLSQGLELLREATELGKERAAQTGGQSCRLVVREGATPEGRVPQVSRKIERLVFH